MGQRVTPDPDLALRIQNKSAQAVSSAGRSPSCGSAQHPPEPAHLRQDREQITLATLRGAYGRRPRGAISTEPQVEVRRLRLRAERQWLACVGPRPGRSSPSWSRFVDRTASPRGWILSAEGGRAVPQPVYAPWGVSLRLPLLGSGPSGGLSRSLFCGEGDRPSSCKACVAVRIRPHGAAAPAHPGGPPF